eukprot:Hpha_TRINITY_DN28348_c0_g1::TRINITY_DN28348_c0_g1_i1::g.2281::m.2281/K04710/CERS; ceramide synthetase
MDRGLVIVQNFIRLHLRALDLSAAAEKINIRNELPLAICAAPFLYTLMKFARRAATQFAGPSVGSAERKKLANEAASSVWHSFALVLAAAALRALPGAGGAAFTPYVSGTRAFWSGFPVATVHPACKVLYVWQMAYYLQGLVGYMLEPPKDFACMVTHHLSALSLILLSYAKGFSVVGLGVLAVHEVSDVFLHAAKAFHYAGQAFWANTLFVSTVGSWAVTRLVIFPRIVYGAAVEAPQSRTQRVAVGLLSVLACLHVHWFHLMVSVLMTASKTGGKLKDPHGVTTTKDKWHRVMWAVRAAVRMENAVSPRSQGIKKQRSFFQTSFKLGEHFRQQQGSHILPDELPSPDTSPGTVPMRADRVNE